VWDPETDPYWSFNLPRSNPIVGSEIFGVSDRIGTIEEGKRAKLFVTDGDAFQPAADVEHLFIDGYKISLESRHSKLYEEFLNRNPGLEK
jgi:hypothetical protein